MNKIIIEYGHSLNEWEETQKSNDFALWDFEPNEVFNGSIEPSCQVYWLINGRLYETNE